MSNIVLYNTRISGCSIPLLLAFADEGLEGPLGHLGAFGPQKSYPFTKIAVIAKILKFNITPSILVKLTCFFTDPTVRLMGVMML